MKAIAKLAIAVATLGSCLAASAQSSMDQQDRRERNRDEAVARWERTHPNLAEETYVYQPREEERYESNKTLGQRTDEAIDKTRSFTHRQLNKMRNFGDRQNAKFQAPDRPVHEDDKRPAAMGSNKP
jgi:hypothetical protein